MTAPADRDDDRLPWLEAMGIDVWQLRVRAPAAVSAIDAAPVPAAAVSAPASIVSPQRPTVSIAPSSASPVPAVLSSSATEADWLSLRQQVAACEKCGLCRTRTQTVFGVGNVQAQWMFVGEAPGADEDAQGEPFVGRAGKLLNNMLFAIGLKREEVYIANVLKCRPPKNRDPQPDEANACKSFLNQQIAWVRPRIIVALGRIAAHNLLACDTPLTRLRGKLHRYEGVPMVVTYHPAYLLRTPQDKRKSWEDLLFAREQLVGSASLRETRS